MRCIRSVIWSSDKTCIARWNSISLFCCWRSSGRLESFYKFKTLLINYQNVPATWKQMYKWIRNLNIDINKLRVISGKPGLLQMPLILNLIATETCLLLIWFTTTLNSKENNRTLTLSTCLNTYALYEECKNRTLYSNLMLNLLLLITY